MEVRRGYKQTEVGAIPEDWDVCPVHQKGEVITGKALAVNAPGTRRPYLRTKNVFDGRIDIADVLMMPMTDEQFAQFKIRSGDVLLNEGQSLELVGRCAIYGDEYPEPCAIQNALLRFRAKADTSDKFASYLFRYCQQTGVFARIALQTTSVAHLGGSRFERLRLAWPTGKEQGAIAETLSDVDALLAGLDHLISKKRDLKQAAMQQLLTGQTRLPGFQGEWEVKSLGDVARFSKGTQLSSDETAEGGKFAHLNGGVTPSSYTHKSNTAGNTIAISEGGNSCGFVQFMTEPYWCGGHCYSVIPDGVNNRYLYQALKVKQAAIMALRVGSGLPNVQKSALLAFKISFPSALPEQVAIAAVLSDMDSELTALEARRDKTRALKQGMMQELLTGRTRLV
jgi:type I restriction enzyme S subunit